MIVAIGGLGGSGTRAFAQIVEAMGVFMGWDLNAAHDNLLFTTLMKPTYRSLRDIDGVDERARRRLDVFVKISRSRFLTVHDRLVLTSAIVEVARRGHDHNGSGRGRWALDRLRRLRSPPEQARTARDWGWKEPNTHIFLPWIARLSDDIRYLHVVRHGLDMAFSKNETQMRIWGGRFGIQPPIRTTDGPPSRFHYWLEANRRADHLGERLLGDRYQRVRLEDLCESPDAVVREIAGFLGLKSVYDPARLAGLAQRPASLGRYKAKDLSSFDPSDLEALPSFGYEVEA